MTAAMTAATPLRARRWTISIWHLIGAALVFPALIAFGWHLSYWWEDNIGWAWLGLPVLAFIGLLGTLLWVFNSKIPDTLKWLAIVLAFALGIAAAVTVTVVVLNASLSWGETMIGLALLVAYAIVVIVNSVHRR